MNRRYTTSLGSSKLKRWGGLLIVAALLAAGACKTNKFTEVPNTVAYRGTALPAPPGMVYVPSGTILYKGIDDSSAVHRNVSVSAFFIDETEVNNLQYRTFVNWVADSVAITDYLQDDSYFIQPKGNTVAADSGRRFINWSKVGSKSPLWEKGTAEERDKLLPMTMMKGTRRVLDPEKAKYRLYYIRMAGGNTGEYVMDTISVWPKETVWSSDFPNSQMQVMDQNYFTNKIYDYNPVVGVTWKQARAYADWRGIQLAKEMKKNPVLRDFDLVFSLPTEVQWQYAAEGKIDPADTIDRTKKTIEDKKTGKEKLALNFKQGEGTYSRDGSTFTLPVKSYTPNAFGLYNTAGNVSEWTMDAYSPSASAFVNDLNPVLLYDVPDDANPLMKRKVVRGGSWKDNGNMLNSDARTYEEQDMPRSYIGFRCVMSAIELPTEQVKTRKYKLE
ncbi:SUMF1/EgtB/PvdO family nonheme iron enzyme [Olivibacter sitiensis]|uniref:type IX secretion system lipoprotein PorK/GldK n=1 Tax=Olivibacter sitiensis TaxID=376470 RepID=UPI00040757E5|nr:SUMF1/EgtB/PvdO family nonheme iron enzyme [Olivibacter sitiensis]